MTRGKIHTKVFDFIIFSNIFIAICAVLMAAYTWLLFAGKMPGINFLGFIFFSTLASYSIHWYLTDETVEITASRTGWLSVNKKIYIVFFFVSALGSAFFLITELQYVKWILPAVFLTVMYSAPKLPHPLFKSFQRFVLGKTILLAAMWMYVTCALPILLQPIKWEAAHTLFCINRYSLIFAICILFDLRDKEYDKNVGIKTLITHLTVKKVIIIFKCMLMLCIATSLWHYTQNQHIVHSIFLLAPAVATWLLHPLSIKTKNDYLFYFILDGLMALSPILYISYFIF